MIKVAPHELSEALDLTLQFRTDFFTHPQGRRLLLRRSPVPVKKALADCEDRIERRTIGIFAIEPPLAFLLIRTG